MQTRPALVAPTILGALLVGATDLTLHLQAAFLTAEGDLLGPLSLFTILDDVF